jgi:hypothetical protein
MGITQQIGASSLIRPGVIDNAAARPASPYEGQAVYQKDTDQVLFWNGTAWYPNWNLPWGYIAAPITITTNQTSITTAVDVTGASFTVTLIGGRRYRYKWQGLFQCASAAKRMNIFLSDGSTTFTQTLWIAHDNATDYTYSGWYVESAGTTSTATRKLRVQQQDAATFQLTNGSTYPLQFSVEDIGPV